ncbi:MAG: polysaccharide deacetylase family protein [Planctomycetes bacterium]|nr:polysaccharide deacetylase family protein [Planctomycetota bacterium]
MSDACAWPGGARCAVTLGYDDSWAYHHSEVAPALERRGLRGTFYVTISTDPLRSPEPWRRVAAAGHELGNHSVNHPCRRDPPEGFQWLEACYDLRDYTETRLEQELRVANLVLHLIDGKSERTYGNTCCAHAVGRGADERTMDAVLAKLFVAARGPGFGVCQPAAGMNLMRVGLLGGDRRTFAQLRAEIERAILTRGWINFMFHGVGKGTHALFIERDEHEQLLDWLAQERGRIWTAPCVEVATHVRAQLGMPFTPVEPAFSY